MKTRLFTLLLVLAMVLCCFAGCAKTETPAAETPAAETPAASETPAAEETPTAEEPAAEEAPADEAPEAPAEEAPAAQPEDAAPATVLACQPPMGGLTYPLEGQNEISLWYYSPAYSSDWEASDNNDFYCVPYTEMETGVHINFIQVSQTAATEQYSLMIASGDWPDINPVNEYYTGGLTQAYEDDVILDLLDYAYDYMPNFTYLYDQLDEANLDLALTDGHLLSFINIADGSYSGNGLVTRGDWMDEQGISFDGQTMTLDQFTDLLHTFRDAYGVEVGYPSSDGTVGIGGAAFDTTAPCLISDGFMSSPGLTIFRYGDEVVSGWTTDGYYDYLTWFYSLLQDGTLTKVTEVESDRMAQNTMQANGEISTWQANADKLDEVMDYVSDPEDVNCRAQALPTVVADESQLDAESVWIQAPQLVSKGMSISSDCDQVELVCNWMNYFWTEEGTKIYNYGIEETVAEELDMSQRRATVGPWYGSYRYNDAGEVEWTEMVTDTTDGGNAEKFSTFYSMSRFTTSLQDNDRLLSTFSDQALAAVELWTITGTDQRYYPSAITLSASDNERVNALQGDVLTYGCEHILLMLDGQTEINQENWDAYVEGMNGMGLTEIVEIYQAAYDEYIGK